MVLDTILVIVVVLVGIQLWLLTIGVEAYLGQERNLLWPSFGASALCLLINGYLLRYVLKLSRMVG